MICDDLIVYARNNGARIHIEIDRVFVMFEEVVEIYTWVPDMCGYYLTHIVKPSDPLLKYVLTF